MENKNQKSRKIKASESVSDKHGLRLRTDAAKRFKRAANATAVIWTMLMIAESRFRRLNAPELAKRVYLGIEYQDGVEITTKQGAVA